MLKIHLKAVALICSVLFPSFVFAGSFGWVTNGHDSGKGSLRDALEKNKRTIVIHRRVDEIVINSPLIWDSHKSLNIIGSGQTISGDTGDQPLLEISKGANLSIKHVDFAAPGHYSIVNPGGGKGIFVNVPDYKKGTVKVSLNNVAVSGTGNHGIHISDCSIGDDCGGGQGGGGEGSDASMTVWLNNVTVDGAGFGKQDADGLRVDDRGPGDITLFAHNITFVNVGGDGIELDEGNEGNVAVWMKQAFFQDNGAYCSDELVDDPIAIDPNCNDDGDPDVDDAFDIDESGPGGIWGVIANADLIHNYDEGLDFDTEGEGENNFVDLHLINIEGYDNADEAIKVSEEGNASIFVKMVRINIGGDVEVEEEDEGSLFVSIFGSYIGDDLKLSEKGDGKGTVKLRNTEVVDKKDYEGDGITEL